MNQDWIDAAIAVQRAWKQAFEARDLERLASLYADDTAFYGSTAAFHRTPEGVRRYFAALSPAFIGVDFAVPHVVVLGPDAMAASGEVMFHTAEGGLITERPYRMTHVLRRVDGTWKIATHHASPRPPAVADPG